ncbi:cell division protein ScpA [Bifidobacterium ramosum]|uniref:Segregation and condensation protein A n=1 Tax=Bifidobacterium ramosum TaxID=1798158 RepID=A0A6L4X2B2_9BIFI|nr:ScpA family protein [Bifidobacterium ramosum]KAB8289131.1 cell division protein ScpA [Bifidobacterium ramosum]NEG70843.1 segregation/condensation protein A [Bifidobacterium ramosum]
MDDADRAAGDEEAEAVAGFHVSLDVYAGPFDALLGMIANKRLELTEVSLSAITEEFLAYVRGMDFARNMDEASAFLDVASVLVEAKSAALLPGDDDGARDEASMEALRERDLLFARLLQYRAFKRAAGDFRARIAANAGRFPHPAAVDDAVAAMLPDLVWTLTPDDLARLAAHAFANAPADEVSTHQLHVPLVDLRAQSALVRDRLRALPAGGSITFAELTADATSRIEIVARFLAILAFFKQGAVQFKQDGPYAPLHVRWAAGVSGTAGLDRGDGAADGADIDISEKDFA